MREYNKIPGYEGYTPLDARSRYLHDLIAEYQGITSTNYACKRIGENKSCSYCSFSGMLGGDLKVCCNWRAEGRPDDAIRILEKLLGKEVKDAEPELPLVQKIQQIANYYGIDNQVSIAQEELAELIQALSKYRRANDCAHVLNAYADVIEEMADVTLMLQQLRHLLDINDDEITRCMTLKVERQLRRIAEESDDDEV